jgi:hypothetical protein
MADVRPRSSPAQLVEKRASLLSILDGCARAGHVCPSLGRLAGLLRLAPGTVHEMFQSLRNAKVISWTLAKVAFGGGRIRVVTIRATGLTTALPGTAKQRAQPKKPGPVFIGPPVRILDREGADAARFLELEARDRDERARAQA